MRAGAHQIVDRGHLPRKVVQPDLPALWERRVRTDSEQREVMVVVGRAGTEEHGIASYRTDDLEVERLLIELTRRLRVAHVQHGMVQRLDRDHVLPNPLSRSTIPGNAPRNASMSDSVELQPTLARSEWSASTPIAASTGDGSSASLEHDEPEWTATPCWSRARRIGSASTPVTPRHTRWGTRSTGSPKRSMSRTDASVSRASRSVSAPARVASRSSASPPSSSAP